MDDLSKKPVRGIIVAADFDIAAVAGGNLVGLQLRKYSFRFSFESVTGTS
jgi:hypothetical protein